MFCNNLLKRLTFTRRLKLKRSALKRISFFMIRLKTLDRFEQWRQQGKLLAFCILTVMFSQLARVDVTWSNAAAWETKGLHLIVPLSTLNWISLLKIQQASKIIYVEHSCAFWLRSERIMLQASCLQPTGQLNLDLPNNGTKIHSCVTILHRRHGKAGLISFSLSHLWCINKASVFWHLNNQELSLWRQIDKMFYTTY